MSTKIDVGDEQRHVARLIQNERAARGLTYQQIADRAGLPMHRVYRALECRQNMLFDDFLKIARAMNLSPLELVADTSRTPLPDAKFETADTYKPGDFAEAARMKGQ